MTIRKAGPIFVALVAVVALACGGGEPTPSAESTAAAPKAAAAPAGSGKVSGTITYTNGDPDTEIKMDADPVCGSLHEGDAPHTEKIVAGEGGGLANVFVYVKSGLAGGYQAPADTHLLDQVGCQYTPHVSGMMVGQTLVIRNSDPTLHNVHALPQKNKEFNQGQPFQGMELSKVFEQPEVMIRFKCDVHPWMSSYMGVLEHPFFDVTDESGAYSIDGLPDGTYTLEAWHEELGPQTQEVTVAGGGAAEASWEFAGAAAAAGM